MDVMAIYKDRLNEDARSPWLPFWACLSVGILVKGPIGPLLVLTSCVVLCGLDRNIGWLKQLQLFKGLFVTAVLFCPGQLRSAQRRTGLFWKVRLRVIFCPRFSQHRKHMGRRLGHTWHCWGYCSGLA